MTGRLVIALAQLNQSVGDFRANAEAMLMARDAAAGADLILFPELQLTGYPPEDLVLKPAFVAQAAEELARLVEASTADGAAMLVGTVLREEGRVYNAVVLLEGGVVRGRVLKHELPNYGTFDEKRVFASGPLPEPLKFGGVRIGVPICEDAWLPKVPAHLKARGAEILLSPNGSPYELDKDDVRARLFRSRVAETGLPLVYLNRVGGQDEIVFDGSSFVVNADGGQALQMPDWEEAVTLTEWQRGTGGWRCEPSEMHGLDPYPADIYHAMLVGLRDYVGRNRFPGVVLGLSGGIDSHLTAAVAVDALGADRVWCVMMPSIFTSRESLEDAAEGVRLLGCRLDTIPINAAVETFGAMLMPSFEGRSADIAEENIQARLRMVTLMALSNKFGHMPLTTGNKSEMSVGYATLYGDMAGGYSVLKDAYKTTVFALASYRNAHRPRLALGPEGIVIPERVIAKPPTAELRENQKDSDSLPPYELLDRILHGLVEEELSISEVAARGIDRAIVEKIERLLNVAEYKRRQAPPGVKIGRRNFGRDRRYPITHGFRSK